jgi:DNA polymerase III subunit epsilon
MEKITAKEVASHVGEHKGYKETFTIFDFETTGLDYTENQVIELAAIKTDLTQEYGRFTMLVSLEDGRVLDAKITELTGITEGMLKSAGSEFAAMIALAAFIGNDTVVAHYAPFDFSYLRKYGIEPKFFICTRSLAKFLYPSESASLSPTCERLGIKLEGAHRAMNDVEATAQLLGKLMNVAAEKGIERKAYQNLIVDSAERPNRFTPAGAKVIEMS